MHRLFAERGLAEQVVWGASAKVGLPDGAIYAMALGADLLHAAREPMLAIGCIQAKKCHTDHCPTGVATQSVRLARGLDPTLKSVRCANYVKTLRRDLLKVAQDAGHLHPALLTTADLEVLGGDGCWRSGQALGGQPAGVGAALDGRPGGAARPHVGHPRGRQRPGQRGRGKSLTAPIP